MTNPRFRSLRKRSRSVVYGIGITRVVFLFPPLLDFSLVDSRTFEAGIKDKERRRKHGANRLYEESSLAFFFLKRRRGRVTETEMGPCLPSLAPSISISLCRRVFSLPRPPSFVLHALTHGILSELSIGQRLGRGATI